jgi:hypothetical protein
MGAALTIEKHTSSSSRATETSGMIMSNKTFLWLGVALLLLGCVHQADLDEWKGQSVSKLDKHPFFVTLPHNSTLAADH